MLTKINKELAKYGKTLTYADKGRIKDESGVKSDTSINKYLAGKGVVLSTAKVILDIAKQIVSEK